MTVLKQYNGSSWQPVAVGAQGLTGVQGTSGPQGVQGVQGTTPAGGSYTQLATGSLSGTITTISSIPQTYKNLYVIITGASNSSGGGDNFCLQFNGYSSGGYGNTAVLSPGSAGIMYSDSYSAPFGSCRGGGANGDVVMLTIYNYTNSYYPTFTSVSSYAGGFWFRQGGWASTYQPVTSVSFLTASGYTFNAGSYILYGVN
jgi:hypothetical protein